MSNWFKLFEGDLDETHMRFAISKLPEVWPVWTAVLIECCRHRSDTFPWGSGEQELWGFSDRLKIPTSKVGEAVNLLSAIQYVEIRDGFLKVLKWNEKQDDYLSRKARGYWVKRSEIKKLTVNHSESHLEERRGEENRGDVPTTGLSTQDIPTPKKRNNSSVPDGFEAFWNEYPKKEAKLDAVRAFRKATTKCSVQDLIDAVQRQKRSVAWTKDDGKFIPYASSWLNGERWSDEIQAPQQNLCFATNIGVKGVM